MLIEHLKTAEAEVDEESWRVRQAFQGPQNQLDGFRRRMERSRANLSQQVEKVRRGEN